MRSEQCYRRVAPALRRVPGDVAEGPDGLLLHVLLLRQQQVHEDGHGARVDDLPGLEAGARGDVGERPGRLELQHGVVRGPQELHEPWRGGEGGAVAAAGLPGDDARLYDLVNRRVGLPRQQLPESLGGFQLVLHVIAVQGLQEGSEGEVLPPEGRGKMGVVVVVPEPSLVR